MTPAVYARTKKIVQVLIWIGLGLMLWGGAAWWTNHDEVGKCGDDVMRSGDVCNSISSHGGSSATYEEAIQDKQDLLLLDKALVGGGAAVFVLSAAGLIALNRRE
ncbi:hypothetical protein OG257_03155 [Streptomyces sp. NBC_00683]|uniref:hypothetical protein n=1 Tax=Streptomyces sp. NBC_00683 TaxID=2903670 RepID=UPI002E31789F|nr:hypothetical protein [Streptomyces sp. NBC_00683]